MLKKKLLNKLNKIIFLNLFNKFSSKKKNQELRGRLVRAENGSRGSVYGATNPAFINESPEEQRSIFEEPPKTPLPIPVDVELVAERPEDERESWDSKLTFLLATIG